MKKRLWVFILFVLSVALCEASQGLWQANSTYDVVVWHGYRLSDLKLTIADAIELPITDQGNECVVAKGWVCNFETDSSGRRSVKRFILEDLNLKRFSGNKKSGNSGDLNVWLDVLFYSNEANDALLLGALPLNLYPSRTFVALDSLQSFLIDTITGRRLQHNEIYKKLLPWQDLGDSWRDSPCITLQMPNGSREIVFPIWNQFSEVKKIDNVYSVNDKFLDGGDQKYPGKITMLDFEEGLKRYSIEGVRELNIGEKKEIGSVTFERNRFKKRSSKLECNVKINECRLAICDKHKELRRLYIEFELTSPDLFKVLTPGLKPNLKVEKTEGDPNSLIFFVGIQVQPRNASEICIDDYDEEDELLEDEDEEL